jgi:hypothetical protein
MLVRHMAPAAAGERTLKETATWAVALARVKRLQCPCNVKFVVPKSKCCMFLLVFVSMPITVLLGVANDFLQLGFLVLSLHKNCIGCCK